ncbi:hypothetical protein Patl1_22285 [Pistacia atlantica]|uniref:Uncharacterized protein n=1 Tax=Pistacia atlantica TaxID=434234 RepID=A0ACC0ZTT3_9ROSI|nr:hypothetical protein Patl1_22285 [Pistacia atlantica]
MSSTGKLSTQHAQYKKRKNKIYHFGKKSSGPLPRPHIYKLHVTRPISCECRARGRERERGFRFLISGFSRCLFGMGLEERFAGQHIDGDETDQPWTISVHAFSDLTYISPVVFIYLLKECYIHGTCKATRKFRALQQQVHQVLCNSPQPGPATFVIRCLYVLPIFGLYSEGFSHLIISSLRRYLKAAATSADSSKAKEIATRLILEIVGGSVDHDEKIVVKILEVFDLNLIDIDKSISQLKAQNDYRFDTAKTFIEQYIFALIESQSYMTAVSLLEHFSIRQSGESFLLKMIENKQFKAAEKWATFMGKPMLCLVVQEYADRNMLKNAYDTIKKNNLQHDFPGCVSQVSLKQLAEKACWDVAEAKTKGDKQLLEYLVGSFWQG